MLENNKELRDEIMSSLERFESRALVLLYDIGTGIQNRIVRIDARYDRLTFDLELRSRELRSDVDALKDALEKGA